MLTSALMYPAVVSSCMRIDGSVEPSKVYVSWVKGGIGSQELRNVRYTARQRSHDVEG